MTEQLHVSPTGVQRFATCAYSYYLCNVEGIRPVGTPRPLGFGCAFHEALAAGNARPDSERALRDSLDTWMESAVKWGLCPEDQVIGRVLLVGYWSLYQPEGGQAEQRIEVPLSGPDGKECGINLLCIVDLLGEGFAEEHKTTTSDPTSETYWDRIDRSIQANACFIAAEDTGNPLDHLMWDVIRAPARRRRKTTPIEKREFYKRKCKGGNPGDPKPGTYLEDESLAQFEERFMAEVKANPGAYFVRRKLYRSPVDLEKTRYDLWAYGKQIEAAIAAGAFPRNMDSCKKYRRPCDYYAVCHEGVNPRESELYQIRQKEDDDVAPWED